MHLILLHWNNREKSTPSDKKNYSFPVNAQALYKEGQSRTKFLPPKKCGGGGGEGAITKRKELCTFLVATLRGKKKKPHTPQKRNARLVLRQRGEKNVSRVDFIVTNHCLWKDISIFFFSNNIRHQPQY